MKVVEGNILDAKEKYIAQQCNCLTVRSHGLSKSIISKWDYGDPYGKRKQLGNRNLAVENDRDKPGTIRILSDSNNKDSKNIICMFAQWCPGPPNEISKYKSYPNKDQRSFKVKTLSSLLPNFKIDTRQNRVKWFKECLDEIKKLDIKKVAFPYQIGCGLAKGNWTTYYNMIKEFEQDSGIKCTIYKL
jgi:O-acetyl-ADP-ribose deacetylase (regulator of RNase III)